VIQELSERDGGGVGASLAVAERVDEVPAEVLTGRIVESAAALIGEHEEGGGGHHFRDARDPEGHVDVDSVTVVWVGRRSRSPALGRVRSFDPQKAPVHPRE
jgi:hypothetical protein